MSDTTPPATPGNSGQLRTLAVRITDDLRAQLDIIAQLTGLSTTEEIRLALENWIVKTKSDPNVLKRAEAVRAEIESESQTRQTLLPQFSAGMAKPVVAAAAELRFHRAPQLVEARAPTSNTTWPFERFARGINKAGTDPGMAITVVARVGFPPSSFAVRLARSVIPRRDHTERMCASYRTCGSRNGSPTAASFVCRLMPLVATSNAEPGCRD